MSNSPQKRETAQLQKAQVPWYLTRTKVSLSMNVFSHFKNNIAHGKNFRKHSLSMHSSQKRDQQSEAEFLRKHNSSWDKMITGLKTVDLPNPSLTNFKSHPLSSRMHSYERLHAITVFGDLSWWGSVILKTISFQGGKYWKPLPNISSLPPVGPAPALISRQILLLIHNCLLPLHLPGPAWHR